MKCTVRRAEVNMGDNMTEIKLLVPTEELAQTVYYPNVGFDGGDLRLLMDTARVNALGIPRHLAGRIPEDSKFKAAKAYVTFIPEFEYPEILLADGVTRKPLNELTDDDKKALAEEYRKEAQVAYVGKACIALGGELYDLGSENTGADAAPERPNLATNAEDNATPAETAEPVTTDGQAQ